MGYLVVMATGRCLKVTPDQHSMLKMLCTAFLNDFTAISLTIFLYSIQYVLSLKNHKNNNAACLGLLTARIVYITNKLMKESIAFRFRLSRLLQFICIVNFRNWRINRRKSMHFQARAVSQFSEEHHIIVNSYKFLVRPILTPG